MFCNSPRRRRQVATEWEVMLSTYLERLVDVISIVGQPYVHVSLFTSHDDATRSPSRDTASRYKAANVYLLRPASQVTQPAALDAVAAALSDPKLTSSNSTEALAAQVHPLFGSS